MNEELYQRIRDEADEMNDTQWADWMRYFGPRMLDDQETLVDLLCRRAQLEADVRNSAPRGSLPKVLPSEHLAAVLASVGLRITVADDSAR